MMKNKKLFSSTHFKTGSKNMTEKINKRGGRRAGAGRPKGDSRLFSFRCPGELASRMETLDNRTEFINRSLVKALDEMDDLSGINSTNFRTGEAISENGEIRFRTGENISWIGEAVKATGVAPMHLPYFDLGVTAGFPVPLDNDEKSQDIELLRLLCPHPEASYLIRVKGDSMIDAGVMSGDIIIVDKSNREPSPKEIAVCEINGEYTLKHFVKEGETGWLVPDNPDYKKRQILDGDDFSVWGTVTYIIHKARD